MPDGGVLSNCCNVDKTVALDCISSTAFCPVMATIRLTPEERDASSVILKEPISPVCFTWVPPQSSKE